MRTIICLYSLFLISFGSIEQSEIKNLSQKINHTKDETDLQVLYDQLGAEYFYAGDLIHAQKAFFKSLHLAEKTKNEFNIASACNNIATVYNEIQQQRKGIPYSLRAVRIQKKLKEFGAISNSFNTLGIAYYQLLNFPKAIENYNQAIYFMLKSPDSLYVGSAYENLGIVYFENKNPGKGIENLKKALYYHQKTDNKASYFSSMVSLSEIYSHINQLDSAQIYLEKCDAIFPEVKSILHMDDYYHSKFIFYEKEKKYDLALNHYQLYVNYKDSLINEESKEEIHSIQDKYKTEKANLKLRAQKRILLKEQQLKKILYLLFSVILLGILFFVFWLRNKQKQRIKFILLEQKKIQLEKVIEGEENERTRVAKDLHDGLVQDLTVLKMNLTAIKLENTTDFEQKIAGIITSLDQTTHDLRNISYQMMPVTLKEFGLIAALEDLFHRTLLPQKIDFEFESFGFESRLSEKIEVSLYRICQELINNVIKHSRANTINVVLTKKEHVVSMVFEDNGTGFNAQNIKKGVGMASLNSRIDLVHGEINFDSTSNTGTSVFIRIPF